MWEVLFSDTAKKQLEKLDRTIQERIINALERIRIRPETRITKLVNESAYKLRVGDYRIIIDLHQDKLLILIIKVGHRREIYK